MGFLQASLWCFVLHWVLYRVLHACTRRGYLAAGTTPGFYQASVAGALCGCHIPCGPNICGLEEIKLSATDYHLLGCMSWVKGLPKLCLNPSRICEQLLLYPFYSWQKLNSQSISNLRKVPQLIGGIHLCGWSKVRGAGGRWRQTGGRGPPCRALWAVQESGFYSVIIFTLKNITALNCVGILFSQYLLRLTNIFTQDPCSESFLASSSLILNSISSTLVSFNYQSPSVRVY